MKQDPSMSLVMAGKDESTPNSLTRKGVKASVAAVQVPKGTSIHFWDLSNIKRFLRIRNISIADGITLATIYHMRRGS